MSKIDKHLMFYYQDSVMASREFGRWCNCEIHRSPNGSPIAFRLLAACSIARVISRDEDLPQIQKGDILVSASTSPAWTPVFSLINGVVVDRGASLSHAAIVGREYGIPVVMNVFEGTTKIKSGKKIRVDANMGAVYILDK